MSISNQLVNWFLIGIGNTLIWLSLKSVSIVLIIPNYLIHVKWSYILWTILVVSFPSFPPVQNNFVGWIFFYLRNHMENKMLASGLLPAYCYYFLLKCWPLTTITTDQQTPSRTRSAVHTDSSYNLLSAAVIVIHAGRHKHNSLTGHDIFYSREQQEYL